MIMAKRDDKKNEQQDIATSCDICHITQNKSHVLKCQTKHFKQTS